MVVTLYKLDFSPPARAVMMTIEALKIPDVEYVDVNLFAGEQYTEEFIKLNPQHTIPTLKDDDFVIWDSHAIIPYLVGKYGKDDSLYPTDLKKRAIVDQRLHFNNGILFRRLRDISEAIFLGGEKAFRPEHLTKLEEAYDITEKLLKSSPWMAGDEFTIADICCVPSINTMNEVVKIDENKYPNITAWVQRCSELEYYQKCNIPGIKMYVDVIYSRLE